MCYGVVYTIVVVIPLVESSNRLEILHGGEGGDVERWLEPQNKSLCLRLISCLSYLPYHSLSIYTHYNKIALSTSNSYLEESRGRSSEPFTGYTTSNLALSDRLHYLILFCIEY